MVAGLPAHLRRDFDRDPDHVAWQAFESGGEARDQRSASTDTEEALYAEYADGYVHVSWLTRCQDSLSCLEWRKEATHGYVFPLDVPSKDTNEGEPQEYMCVDEEFVESMTDPRNRERYHDKE